MEGHIFAIAGARNRYRYLNLNPRLATDTFGLGGVEIMLFESIAFHEAGSPIRWLCRMTARCAVIHDVRIPYTLRKRRLSSS